MSRMDDTSKCQITILANVRKDRAEDSSISVRKTTASPLLGASPRLLSLHGKTKGQSYRFHSGYPEENRVLDLDWRLHRRIVTNHAQKFLIVGILPDISEPPCSEPADSWKSKAARSRRDFDLSGKEDDAFAVVARRSSEREEVHASKASVFVTREADGRANRRREIRVPKVAGARASATLSSRREYQEECQEHAPPRCSSRTSRTSPHRNCSRRYSSILAPATDPARSTNRVANRGCVDAVSKRGILDSDSDRSDSSSPVGSCARKISGDYDFPPKCCTCRAAWRRGDSRSLSGAGKILVRVRQKNHCSSANTGEFLVAFEASFLPRSGRRETKNDGDRRDLSIGANNILI